jgi:maltose-binding protein MalE
VTCLVASPLPARAALNTVTITTVVDDVLTLDSVSVQTIAIVTQSEKSKKKSMIECHYATAKLSPTLQIVSKDQRRIEALYQQIVTAAAAGQSFQITAYAHDVDGTYVADLESDVVYLILH